jgi:hypothetical protein
MLVHYKKHTIRYAGLRPGVLSGQDGAVHMAQVQM